jgi:hypothetical protein
MGQNVQAFKRILVVARPLWAFWNQFFLVQRELYHPHDCDFLTTMAGG